MKRYRLRDLSEKEREQLLKELKSSNKTVVWRSQAVLMHRNEQLTPQEIAKRLGYSREMIRQVLHDFDTRGLAAIYPQSRARKADQRAFDNEAREKLTALVRQSPREFGHESSLWTLSLLAEVSYAQGLTDRVVNPDTVNETLSQMGISWKKAKRHLQSPDEQYVPKKNDAIG